MTREEKTLYMRELIAKFHKSGDSIRQFASAHGMSKGKLNYWVQRFKDTRQANVASNEEDTTRFIPLGLPQRQDSEPQYIIINKPCGTQIKIPF